MEHIKSAFKALPHVNEVWATKDNHFHLHPNNGGEKCLREDFEEDVTVTDAAAKKATEVIALINEATTEEEVNAIVGDDTRKTVTDAAAKKIAFFTA